MSSAKFKILVGVLLLVGVVSIFLIQRSGNPGKPMAANNNDGDANGSPPFEFPGFAEGALWRGDSNLEELIESRDPVSDWTARVGRMQLVDKDANVNVQSIAEAVRNNNHAIGLK